MKYIKGFDGLRAISIILVVITHLGVFMQIPENSFMQLRILPLISGRTGVNIFFALSGFLITRILIIEKIKNTKIIFKNFYIRRFLRLLPPLILFYIIYLTLVGIGLIIWPKSGFFFSLFYIYNFVPNSIYTGELGHTWSLALEEQYYLIWPFVLSFLRFRKVVWFIFVTVVLCVIWMYILPTFSFIQDDKVYFINKLFDADRWFIPAVAPILIGSLFALLLSKIPMKMALYFSQKKILLLVSIVLFVCPLYFPLSIMIESYIIQAIGISLFLTWILHNQNSRIAFVLEFRPLAYIGKISYGIYVFQGLFLRTGPSGELFIQKFPQNIILTLVVAILSYELFEKKILKLKNKFT